MKKIRIYHLFFALALVAMTMLACWWIVNFKRSVEIERDFHLQRLDIITYQEAIELSSRPQEPLLGIVATNDSLEVIRAEQRQIYDHSTTLFAPYSNYAVRPTKVKVEKIEQVARGRLLIVLSEGILLVFLIGIFMIMLYRLVTIEHLQFDRWGHFLSAVTHELKTPLAGISSMLQTFAAGKIVPAQQQTYYGLALRELERLEHMIENILISGRLKAREYQIDIEPIKIRALVSAFIEHRRAYLVGKPQAINLIWELEQDETGVLAEVRSLRLILENLTDNAFKYGGENPEVRIRVKQVENKIAIAIEDQGIGFTAGQQKDLFTPFKRTVDHKSIVRHGSGLGLSISRHLARRLDSTIVAQSPGPGRGATFTILLPPAKTEP